MTQERGKVVGTEGGANSLTRETGHALNNIFAVIQLNASMALDGLNLGKKPEEELREILSAVGRGREILRKRRGEGDAPKGGQDPVRSGPEPVPASATGRYIMIVDDERALAELGQRLLVKKGYRVTYFSDSREALQAFLAAPQGFDLVVTDQNMPGLNGIELAGELLKIRPDMPILLCTGYSTDFSRWNFREQGFAELLVKPYQPAELLSAVRAVLNSGR